jgi:hypothetical protein
MLRPPLKFFDTRGAAWIIVEDFYQPGPDPIAMERRRAAVRRNQVTNVAREVLWMKPTTSDPVAKARGVAMYAASMTSDRIRAKRWYGRHV